MYLFFYSFSLWLYRTGIKIASNWNPKAKQWYNGRKKIFQRLANEIQRDNGRLIWMHCASLGEFEQGRPVLEKIRERYPHYKILLTFFSPSGYEVQKSYSGADYIFYLPSDSKTNARRFLNIVNPELVLWVKYEYWFFYLRELKQRKIPSLLVSGIFRKDQPFFSWYGKQHKKMLQSFTQLFVQNDASKRLLQSIGFSENVIVSGDTRFDRVVDIAEKFQPITEIEKFCGNAKIIVAGSTWPEDEEVLDHYANIHMDIKFIIVPHEIDTPHLKDIERLFKKSIRYSRLKIQIEEGQWLVSETKQSIYNVLIIDNIGMLSRLYKYATITYVGGGFGEDGVHNTLEAAVYGKPVIFGPAFDKYIEAVELLEEGGAFTIQSALELEQNLDDLFADEQLFNESCEAAKNYVYAKKGATEKIITHIHENRLLTS